MGRTPETDKLLIDYVNRTTGHALRTALAQFIVEAGDNVVAHLAARLGTSIEELHNAK